MGVAVVLTRTEAGQTRSTGRVLVDRAAFVVSALTSPFLVTALTAASVVWFLQPSLRELVLWVAIAAAFSALIPFFVVFVLWRSGRVADMHVAVREQRTIPLAAAIISAVAGIAVLRAVHAPPQLLGLGAAFVANGVALAIITRHWKASIHAATFAASVIALALVESPYLLVGLVALPLVFWARLHRKRHSLAQGVVPVVLVSAVTPTVYLLAVAVLSGG